ncbi:hypothetical protein ACP4OV_024791 [Aristida adscensionis]
MAPYSAAASKRALAMVVFDPDAPAAAAAQQRESKRPRQDDGEATQPPSSSSSSPGAGALVPHAAAASSAPPPPVHDVQPIGAVPIPSAVRVPRHRPLKAPPPPPAREPPPCLRKHFLAGLNLRPDLPVHYIDEKVFTSTDLTGQQNRFRIPTDGATRRLRPLLTPTQLADANLLHDPPPKPRRNKPPQDAGADGEEPEGKKPKKKGEPHGGLKVNLVHLTAGCRALKLTRWSSSSGTVVKGEGYSQFIRDCDFKDTDVVEIWALVQRPVRLFGVTLIGESRLHLLVVKKGEPPRCSFCPPAPAAAAAAAANH